MTAPITHLRVHSYFSFLRSVPSIDQLIERAKEDGLKALALTDHNGLFGAVRFHKKALAAGIRPIIGLTCRVAAVDEGGSIQSEERLRPHLLTLIATRRSGYSSLSRLATLLQAAPEREIYQTSGLPWDALQANSSGLIAILNDLSPAFEQPDSRFEPTSTRAVAETLRQHFGENSYFGHALFASIGHRVEAERQRAHDQVEAMGAWGLRPVALRPVYQLHKSERPLLKLMAAIADNRPLETVEERDLPHQGRSEIDLSWATPHDMRTLYAQFPESLANIDEIVGQCEEVLPDGSPIWPVIDLPNEITAAEQLRQTAEAFVRDRFGDDPVAWARLDRELSLIENHGFAPLFIILAEVVAYARQEKIPVISRGSVANSLVAFAVGITKVDPLEHDLYFERFLNPARVSLPDIDLDFDSRLRDQILEHIRRRYGSEQVALISTVNFFRAKSAVRETAKALGLPKQEINQLAKKMPSTWAPSAELREKTDLLTYLEEIKEPAHQEVLRWAQKINGFPSHLGLHPGGVVIAPPPGMQHFAPLQLSPKGFLATQFDFRDVEQLGLVKVDILGIRALSVIRQAVALINRFQDPTFEIDHIRPDDEKTGELLAKGDTIGCFQAESYGAANTLRKLKARNARDLAVCNAFFKPGPVRSGQAHDFVSRYRGEKTADFLHPALEAILHKTKGTILFQEQVLRICVEIAGLSWTEANQIRKGISKFKADMLDRLEANFVQGCCDNQGFSRQQATALWHEIRSFAGYGFNEGHATAYALPTYQMAFLKAHYPAEFLTARLAEQGGYYGSAIYIAEARRHGLQVHPPHINFSHFNFTLRYPDTAEQSFGPDGSKNRPLTSSKPSIWMGLDRVRDLRHAAIKSIIAERQKGRFHSLQDLLKRVQLQTKEIQHLIQCGGLDGFGLSRSAHLKILEENDSITNQKGKENENQLSLFDTAEIEAENEEIEEAKNEDIDSLHLRFNWEHHILGQPVSVHPIDPLDVDRSQGVPLVDLPQHREEPVWILGGRLPGWTGLRNPSFFLDDGRGFVVVEHDKDVKTVPWTPYAIKGSWVVDQWGGGRFKATRIESLLARIAK